MCVLAGTSGWQYRDWRDTFYPPAMSRSGAGSSTTPAVRHGREQRDLLPAAAAGDVRQLAGAGQRRLHDDGQGQPLPHPRAAAARPGRTGAQAARGGGRARRPARTGAAAAAAGPAGRPAAARRSACASSRRRSASRSSPGTTPGGPARCGTCSAPANAALCWADRKGSAVTPLWRTADWGYLRLHEGDGAPWPSYRESTLGAWADRITATWARPTATSTSTSTTTRVAPRRATRPGWPPAVARHGGHPAPGSDAARVAAHGGAVAQHHRPGLGRCAGARRGPDRRDGRVPAGRDRRRAALPARRARTCCARSSSRSPTCGC